MNAVVVEREADGFYDRETPHREGCPGHANHEDCECGASESYVAVFCGEDCANRFHGRQVAA